MRTQLTLVELQKRSDMRERVQEAEVIDLLSGSSEDQQAALRGLYVSELRQTVKYLAELAKSEQYRNQDTIDLLKSLGATAAFDEPILDLYKAMGIQHIAEGRFVDGLNLMQAATNDGWITSSNKSDPYHQRLMSYMHDPEIDSALATIAHSYTPPTFRHERKDKRRVVLFVSTILGESSPTIVMNSIALDLLARGYEVIVVSSEFWCGSLDSICRWLADQGIPVELAPNIPQIEKIQALIGMFLRLQPDLVLFMITPMDFIGKIMSEIGLAPAQAMFNMAYEHHCGKFDYVLQSTSPEQERATAWPGKSKYIGSFAALEPRLIAEAALQRAEMQIPEDAVVLVTHGRVSKCSSEYITAVGRILQANPNAVLVLAGPIGDIDFDRFNAGLAGFNLGSRIIVLGPIFNKIPNLLKACDIYLDPFPWPGGQSTLEAMWAGLPIVAMRCVQRNADDPDTYGPIGSATDAFLPQSLERAAPGDLDAYCAIASRYINDLDLRVRDGEDLRMHVARNYSFELFMNRLDSYLSAAIEAHEPAYA